MKSTPEHIVNIIISSSKTVAELSCDLNIPKSTIRNIRSRHGIFSNKSINESEILNLYEKLNSVKLVSEALKIDRHTVSKYLNKNNIKTNKILELTNEEINFIIENYTNYTAKELSIKFKTSVSYINKVWSENGLIGKLRFKYKFNHNYFESIDTKNKAYLLGILMSDGCVYSRTSKVGQKWIRLSIHSQDLELLEFFNKELESEVPIQKNNRGYISLTFVSDKMADDLSKFGIVERKTWKNTLNLDSINEEFKLPFLIGFLDGDGCISCYKNKTDQPSAYNISFVGNLYNLTLIKEILNFYTIDSVIREDMRLDKYSDKFYSLNLKPNVENKYKFSYLYINEECFKLARKLDKFKNFIFSVKENKTNKIKNKTIEEKYKEMI